MCGWSRILNGLVFIVTDNMFRNIITDLGAIIQADLVLKLEEINPEGVSMFEQWEDLHQNIQEKI